MKTGSNKPGTLAEARRTFRNNSSASGRPLAAIAPMFHNTGRWASRLVVTTKSRRPLTVGGSDIGQHCLIDLVSDDLLEGSRIVKAFTKQPQDGIPRQDSVKEHLPCKALSDADRRRTQESERRHECTRRNACHDAEARTSPGFAPPIEQPCPQTLHALLHPRAQGFEKSRPPFNAGKFATWGLNTESGASAQIRTAGDPHWHRVLQVGLSIRRPVFDCETRANQSRKNDQESQESAMAKRFHGFVSC